MQKIFRCLIFAAGVATASTAMAGELKLSVSNGRATLIATDVPARQILAEWARIGGIKIVNGDRVMGPNLTVQLIDRPEREVLDTVLRTVAGYVAAPRAEMAANLSVFDKILILPTSQAPAYNPSMMSTPTFTRPPSPVVPEDEPVEQPNVMPPGANVPQPPGAMPQGPQVQQRPGMPAQQPQQQPQSQPLTLPRPGMLPPPAPGVPNPYAPGGVNQPVRPPGPGRGGGPGGQ
jgi:hypothetical protein